MRETSWVKEEEQRETGHLFVIGYKQESTGRAGCPASVTQLSYPSGVHTQMIVGILCMDAGPCQLVKWDT